MRKALSLLFVVCVTLTTSAQWQAPVDVPAFNPAPPAKGAKLEPIMSGNQLTGEHFQHNVQVEAYKRAAKIPNVLYQQPCYCHCDKHSGHTSLRSCFETTHGAMCGTCMAEAYYAYKMTKAGKTPKEIRAGIIAGEFQKIDLRTADKQ